MTIIVKLVETGPGTCDYSLPSGSKVSDLFEVAGKNFVQGNVRLKNREAYKSDALYDGDRVFNGHKTKGNQDFDVQIVRTSGKGAPVINLGVENGITVGEALDLMEDKDKETFFKADGKIAYEMRINGSVVNEDDVIPAPESNKSVRIFCALKTKGND